jgi:hypothetical protein
MSGPSARNDGSQGVQTLRKRITYVSNGTTVTVGKLPAGASVINGGVHIVTAFNDSGTDTLIVGFIGSTTDDNAYATLLDLSAVGFIVLDELAATTNIQQSVEATVTCVYAGQNSNATAGVADVIVNYVCDNG